MKNLYDPSIEFRASKLPDLPGVYLMKDAAGRILYIGKAGNLRRRVASYFTRPHDHRIEKLVSEIKRIDCEPTDTAIEALILESELIKKHQPPYNVREKDDTSFLFVEITNEKFPRVLLVRGKERLTQRRFSRGKRGAGFGPFTSASSIREALRIIRKIFPYSTHPAPLLRSKSGAGQAPAKPCFDYQIGLCPGTCIGVISEREYKKNIRNIILFFRGKKAQILKSLEREMKRVSASLEFEKAEKLKRQIFALRHIRDVALIREELPATSDKGQVTRIEGYDISNISGTSAVGSLVVFRGGKPDKNEYRKFKIRTIRQSDDVGMLKEVLRRRFGRHARGETGWALPNVILIDGGRGQVNAAKAVLNEVGLNIPVIGIVKGPERKRNDLIGFLPKGIDKKTLIRVRDEAHRFAIQYHKKVRGREFLASKS